MHKKKPQDGPDNNEAHDDDLDAVLEESEEQDEQDAVIEEADANLKQDPINLPHRS